MWGTFVSNVGVTRRVSPRIRSLYEACKVMVLPASDRALFEETPEGSGMYPGKFAPENTDSTRKYIGNTVMDSWEACLATGRK